MTAFRPIALNVPKPDSFRAPEDNDCAVRALAVASGLPYDDCHAFMELHGRKPRRGTFLLRFMPVRGRSFPELGFRATKTAGPQAEFSSSGDSGRRGLRSGLTVTLGRFAAENARGSFLVRVSGHALVIQDGVVVDLVPGLRRRVLDAWSIERL